MLDSIWGSAHRTMAKGSALEADFLGVETQ